MFKNRNFVTGMELLAAKANEKVLNWHLRSKLSNENLCSLFSNFVPKRSLFFLLIHLRKWFYSDSAERVSHSHPYVEIDFVCA